MSEAPLVTTRIEHAVAHVRLARPEKRNAFDDHTAATLAEAFRELAGRDDLRAVVLGGEGKAFCAGGDLAWMRRVADYTDDENLADAAAFQTAFDAIDRCPVPVIARVQGAALGGGAGLLAVCDVVVCTEDAKLGFPEVRLGLVPGVVAPYVVRRIGPGQARRLFLTGRILDAAEALRVGLVDEVVTAADLDVAVEKSLAEIALGAPGAQARAKALVRDVLEAVDTEARALVARRAIADARASDEGRAGTVAFLERKDPPWRT